MTKPCIGCPYTDLTGELQAGFRHMVDEGHWVPCVETVRPPIGPGYQAKIEAWRGERECATARNLRKTKGSLVA